jgi:autotransporter-associated beta strand protein
MKTPLVSRRSPILLTLTLSVLALQIPAARAANFVMNGDDTLGQSSFNAGTHWTGGAAPALGNTYQTAAFRLRTPQVTGTAFIFQGDSLEVQAGNGFRNKTQAGVITVTNLILASTAILELSQPNNQNLATSAGTMAGGITLNGTATFRGGISGDNAGHVFTIASTIAGTGGFTTAGQVGKVILSANNSYSGGTTIAAGTLQLGDASAVSNSTVTVSVVNSLLFSSGIGAFNLGGLAGGSSFALTDVAAAAVTLNVGGNNSSSAYNGVLSGLGGVIKSGTGVQTLSNTNTYAGTTIINAGKLGLTSGARNTNNVTVSDAATLGVTVSGTNQFSPANLTLGGSTGATNEFLGLTSTTIAPIKPATLTLNGVTTITIVSGNFVGGASYPLINYTTLAGAGSVVLGSLPSGVSANLSTSGNTIFLNVTAVSASLWTGAVSTNWDIASTANWTVAGSSSTYLDGAIVEFNNAGANPGINVVSSVAPASINVSNSSTAYSFSGAAIGGLGGLTKLGSGTLTLNNTNTYAGNTVISNGTVKLGADGALPFGVGKGDVVVTGILDVNGLNPGLNGLSGGGTVDTVVGGAPVLTVGNNNSSSTFSGMIKNSAGVLAVTKVGSGLLTLNGTNTYTGNTTVAGGTLVIGGNNSNGQTPLIVTNAGSTLRFATNVNYASAFGLTLTTVNDSETITVDSGAQVSLRGLDGGSGGNASMWLGGGGTLRLTNAATTFAGLLRINNATLVIDDNAVLTDANNNLGLQIGSGVVPGAPTNGTGTVTVRGNGQLNMTLQGIRIASDGNGASGVLNVQDSGVVTTPLIYLPRQGNNTGAVNQVGGMVSVTSIQGAHSVAPTNWLGVYNLNGGTLAWGAVFGGGPVDPSEKMLLNLNGGTLQFTGSGTIGGWSAINVWSNSALVDITANAVTLNDGLVAGDAFGGGLRVTGAGGTLTLAGTNSFTGSTVVSNSTLALSLPAGATSSLSNSPTIQIKTAGIFDVSQVASGFHVVTGQTLRGNGTVSGAVTVDAGGTLTVGGNSGPPDTLTFNNNLTLAGNAILRINKGGTSDLLTGIATLQAGGTLTLASVGAALAAGDTFPLFSASTINGAFNISPLTPGAGLAWDQSQLGAGIIAVIVAPAAPIISPPLQNQTVECGGNANFSAFSTGASPLYFQWSSNGVPVTAWTTNNPNFLALNNVHSAGSVYTISVVVTNSVGSTNSSATLTVQDTTAPAVVMNGASPMTVLSLSTFVDPGATASDGCEGSLVVNTNSTVDTSVPGTYQIIYTATDSSANSASATRIVNVVSAFGQAWTNQVGGVWSAATNWLNGVVANGNQTIADFSTIDLPNDVAVALDSSRTIAGLSFGDTNIASAAGWTLNNNGNSANVLTLNVKDATAPVITVNALAAGKAVTISARLAGTNGLTKTGNGILILSAANTYTNLTTVAGGTLVMGGSGTNLQTDFALTNANTTLRFSSNANYTVAGGINISTTAGHSGEIVSVESGAEVVLHGLTGGNNASSDTWFNGGGTLRLTNASTTYSGRLRLNNLHLIIDKDAILTQDSANVASSQIGSGLVPNTPANATGRMTVRANGQFIQTAQGLRLGSDGNGATGILNVQDQGVVTVPLIYLPRTSGNTGVVNQVGGTVTTAAIQGPGGGAWDSTYNLNGGTLAWGGTFTGGPTAPGQSTVLNLNGGLLQFTAAATVAGWTAINVKSSGAIIDTAGNAVTFTDPLIAGDGFGGGLTKTGNGTLTFSGTNTYVGNTTVNAGILELALPGLATTAKVIVTNGAVLQLDFTVTNTISALVLNGVTKTPGVYNNATDPTYLTGSGSLQVASSVATNQTNITFTVSGNVLTLTWPTDHTGWHLQAQTNSLATGLGTNWVTIPNTDLSHSYTNTINPANGSVFYRIVYP